MNKIKTILINGLKVIVPVVFTLLLLYWVFFGFESFFRGILLFFIDPSDYFDGLGWITAIIFTSIFGLLLQIQWVQSAMDHLTQQFLKLPVIKTLYGTASDFMMLLTKKGVKQGKIVKIDTSMGRMIGIMTQDDFSDLPEEIGTKKDVAVYIPMSYQIGGFTFIVPEDSVEVVDISVQKGIALTMSAYISGKEKN